VLRLSDERCDVPLIRTTAPAPLALPEELPPRTESSRRTPSSYRPETPSRRMSISDVPISPALRASLGMELLPAEEQENQPRFNLLLMPQVVNKAARAFQRTALASSNLAPNDLEVSRGVHVKRQYEFFNPATGKVRVRAMDSGVIHKRNSLTSDGASSESSQSSSRQSSHESCGSASSGKKPGRRSSKPAGMPSPRASPQELPSLAPQKTMLNYELVTSWGVLVGSLLHTTEMDFTLMTDKVLVKRRYCSGQQKKGMVLNSVRKRARLVLDQAWELCEEVAKAPLDTLDAEWAEQGLLVRLFSTEFLDTMILVCNAACKIFAAQPSVVEAEAPCRIFGDIHGQFRDLLLLFWAYGTPDVEGAPMFVFNGDFVDRGCHSLEVIFLLLALKVLLPERVWLVRGNHEDRNMNKKYGFEEECCARLGEDFGPKIFALLQKAFDHLPLACVVGGRVLVVHGGIGDGSWRLNDLRSVKRPLKEEDLCKPEMDWVNDIMWSDPIEDDADEGLRIFGVHESPRSCSRFRVSRFAWNVTKTFCARNGLSLIVRSHQAKKNGRGFDVMHENLLMRVFSARDYERNGNDGAVLLVSREEDHPEKLLTVRPQVLRSLTKARRSAFKHAKEV